MTKAKDLFRMIEWKQAGVIITSTSYFDAFNFPWNHIRSILHVFNFDYYSLSGISFFGFWLYTHPVFLIPNIRNEVLGFSPLVLHTIVNSCALIKWSCLTSLLYLFIILYVLHMLVYINCISLSNMTNLNIIIRYY